MPTTRIGIDGIDEFLLALEEIGDKVALRVIKKESEKACEPILKESIAQCPVDKGTLRDSIRIKKKQQRKKGFAGAEVITGKGFFKGETYYGGMVEFGHKDRGGNQVPPNPFMSRAMLAKKNEVLNNLSDGVKKGIEDAANNIVIRIKK